MPVVGHQAGCEQLSAGGRPGRAWLPLGLLAGLLCLGVAGLLTERGWAFQRAMVLADPDTIFTTPGLATYAIGEGRHVFIARCAACHGSAAKGDPARGIPDLTDQDYLYGEGRVSEIEDIVRHGIRAGDRRGRNFAYMPTYASARPYPFEPIPPLTPPELRDVVQALLAWGGHAADPAAASRGKAVFLGKGGCYDCHGGDARGDPAIGAPNLIDNIWLYGDGSAAAIANSIEHGRKGYSPAYRTLLTAAQTRAVAVFVASLSHSAGVPEPSP